MGTMGREGGGGGAGNSHTDKHGRARTVGEGRVQKLEVRNSRTAGTASALGERSYRTAGERGGGDTSGKHAGSKHGV